MNMPSNQKVNPQLIQRALDAYNGKDYAVADKLIREILVLDPTNAEANHLHGLIAHLCAQHDVAKQLILKAIHFSPKVAVYYDSLGTILLALGEFGNAESCYRKAIELNGSFGQAYNNLAGLLQKIGKMLESEKYYLKAHKLGQEWAYSNYLLLLNYLGDLSAEESLKKHKQWERDYWKKNSGKAFIHNKKTYPKKLKIGYVSGDFRAHSVAYFFEPLLKAHDSNKVETFCYYNHGQHDETSERLQSLADHWCNIEAISDKDAAKQIQRDGIDILIDLSGHSAYNRLGIFARKPAPIQATWLGYPNSTGLSTIDFRIADAITDPEIKGQKHCSEEILRLEHGFLCYQGPDFPVSIAPPSSSNAYITFGSFNNLSKINESVIDAWVKILDKVPKSRLLLKSQQFAFPEIREVFSRKFLSKGIALNRLDLRSHTATTEEHLNLYKEVDIALDTFPYNGTTTTCEALWMGVPVIAILGDRHVSRVSASILRHAGLESLVADDAKSYIELATKLAENAGRLIELRGDLRNQLKESPLTDAKLFARNIENAYQRAVGRTASV